MKRIKSNKKYSFFLLFKIKNVTNPDSQVANDSRCNYYHGTVHGKLNCNIGPHYVVTLFVSNPLPMIHTSFLLELLLCRSSHSQLLTSVYSTFSTPSGKHVSLILSFTSSSPGTPFNVVELACLPFLSTRVIEDVSTQTYVYLSQPFRVYFLHFLISH